jgi:quinol monooxygenase YgiN
MHIVLVYVHVKAECIQAFIEASLDNARNSVLEPGVARFDIIHPGGGLSNHQ